MNQVLMTNFEFGNYKVVEVNQLYPCMSWKWSLDYKSIMEKASGQLGV